MVDGAANRFLFEYLEARRLLTASAMGMCRMIGPELLPPDIIIDGSTDDTSDDDTGATDNADPGDTDPDTGITDDGSVDEINIDDDWTWIDVDDSLTYIAMPGTDIANE